MGGVQAVILNSTEATTTASRIETLLKGNSELGSGISKSD